VKRASILFIKRLAGGELNAFATPWTYVGLFPFIRGCCFPKEINNSLTFLVGNPHFYTFLNTRKSPQDISVVVTCQGSMTLTT
jgi:hypothetical protein